MKPASRPLLLTFPLVLLPFATHALLADDVTILRVESQMNTTDHSTRVTYTTYDALSRQTQSTDPSGNTVTYTYDASTTLSGAGNTTTYTYDAENRTRAATDPSSHVTTYTYDQSGAELKSSSPPYTYDPGYSPIPDSADVDPADSSRGTITYQYDTNNHAIAETDALGHTTRYQYDPNLAGPTSVSGSDALGHTTTYQYDPQNRVISATTALGGPTTTAYDADGNVTVEFQAAHDHVHLLRRGKHYLQHFRRRHRIHDPLRRNRQRNRLLRRSLHDTAHGNRPPLTRPHLSLPIQHHLL